MGFRLVKAKTTSTMSTALLGMSRRLVAPGRTVVRRRASAAKEDMGGYLFGEKPPVAGQARKWAVWEMPYYVTMTGAFVIGGYGLYIKPDTDLRTWAKAQALEAQEE